MFVYTWGAYVWLDIHVCVWLHVLAIRTHLRELDPVPIVVKGQSDPDDIRQVYMILSSLNFVSILTLSLFDGRMGFLVKFSWINWKITMDLYSDYKRRKMLRLESPLYLMLGSSGGGRKWILFSVDRVNVKNSWGSSLWMVDRVTQLLIDQGSQRDCMQRLACTLQVVWRVELFFFLCGISQVKFFSQNYLTDRPTPSQ